MNHCASERRSSVAALPMKLVAAREALLDGQRTSLPGSPQWRALQVLIEEIDALLPGVKSDRPSTLLNLNAGSGLSLKSRASGARVGALHGWRAEAGRMIGHTIEELVAEIRRKGRIGKYDVQTLRQSFFKDGLASRADADLLIELDREVDNAHFSWPPFFISALTEFTVWNSGEPGYIDADKSRWLLQAVGEEGATERGRRALAAIAQEAECFDEAFFTSSISTIREQRRDDLVQHVGFAA